MLYLEHRMHLKITLTVLKLCQEEVCNYISFYIYTIFNFSIDALFGMPNAFENYPDRIEIMPGGSMKFISYKIYRLSIGKSSSFQKAHAISRGVDEQFFF